LQNPDEIGNHPRLGRYIKDPQNSSIICEFYKLIEKARNNGDLAIPLPETGIGMSPLVREGEFHVNATRTSDIDGTNVEDLTRGELSEMKHVHQLWRMMKNTYPVSGMPI